MSAALFDPAAAGGVLPQSRTYTHRSWLYVPDTADPERGTLTISLQKGKGIGSKLERDRYLVERQPPPVGFIGHVFLLVNQTDPTQADAYQVFVGRRDGEQFCTCKAGQCKFVCKHIDALRDAISVGAFDDVRNRAGGTADSGSSVDPVTSGVLRGPGRVDLVQGGPVLDRPRADVEATQPGDDNARVQGGRAAADG